jgi:uncharacterized membrane protein
MRPSLRVSRYISGHVRFYGAAVFGIILYAGISGYTETAVGLLLAWNISVLIYLALVFWLMYRADDARMMARARATDEGRFAVLGLSLLASLASFVATVVVLSQVKSGHDPASVFHASLAVVTIVASWTFIHVIFTEHYAHCYYIAVNLRGDDDDRAKGIRFPDPIRPDYLDFLYFSFTIGVANQTADISIDTRPMRGVALLHSVISYGFNTFILALTINIASNLF